MGSLMGIILAICIGICVSMQPVFTNNISKATGSFEAAFVSISTTFVLIICIVFFFGKGDLTKIVEVPKYFCFAGVMGVIVVAGSIFTIRILGPAMAISIVIAAQIGMSVILEHFGLFGVEQVSISTTRIFGVLLMIGGIIFIKGF